MADLPTDVRLEALIPRRYIEVATREAFASGESVTDVLRRKIAELLNMPEDEITSLSLNPKPNPVTDTAINLAGRIITPVQGQPWPPNVKGTFTVSVPG